MLRTLAAVAARATARSAERYRRRRIMTAITGGVTLADILLSATTKELPRLQQRTTSLPVLAAREAGHVLAPRRRRGLIPRGRSCRAAGTKRTRPVHV
jgi:hypothetical protein